MADAIDDDLVRRTEALLEPGEVALNGAIVRTEFGSEDDVQMHQATLDVGEIVAEHAGVGDWYVYSGNDSDEFASNQHQGLTFEDEFVWECQQLLREGTFDVVIYYRAELDQDAILDDIREAGFEVTGVEVG